MKRPRLARALVASACVLLALLPSSSSVATTLVREQIDDNEADAAGSGGCDCMEYWSCVMSNGTPYSYCGLSESNVCCFLPSKATTDGSDESEPSRLQGPTAGSNCGRKGADSGREDFAEPAEWPWHAAILEKPDDLYVCGASLVDERWVLTAAHCVDDYAGERGASLKVRVGEYDVTTTREALPYAEYDVAAIALYPAFDNATLAHDIALVRLRRPVQRRPHIDVVCLPRRAGSGPPAVAAAAAPATARCVITGWGRRSETSEHSVVLKEVTVPLWRNSACEAALRLQFGNNYNLSDATICAGAEGRDACDGDGGGPLVCEENGQWYQIGVISFGIGCGRRNIPGVYTRVVMYEHWITNTIQRYGINESNK